MEPVTKESMNTLPKIVAIDFDGTLVEDKFPRIGRAYPEMFWLVRKLQQNGVRVILWTSRDHSNLMEAVTFCREVHGIVFDAINENIKEVQEMFHNDTRKVYADLYIDDKAIPHSMPIDFWLDRLGLPSSSFIRRISDGS